jgi:hypothetical protein
MNIQRRCRRSEPGDAGMTLPELLISFVLTGMVVVPIAMALQMALRIPSESGGRSQAALQRSILTSQWTEDVGSAILVDRCVDLACATRRAPEADQTSNCRTVGATPVEEQVVKFTWLDITRTGSPLVTAEYRLRYSAHHASATKVELTRTLAGAAANNGTRALLSGYCSGTERTLTEYEDNPGQDPSKPYYGTRRQQAKFTIRESPFETPVAVNLEASQRTSCTNGEVLATTTTTVAVWPGAC